MSPSQVRARRYTFVVEKEGKQLGTFRKVEGLGIETELVEFREGGNNTVKFLPGSTKYSPVKLSRTFSGDSALWDWHQEVARDAQAARARVVIIVKNHAARPIARFELTRAWPRKYEGPELHADGNDVPMESLELAHEGLQLISVQ